MSDAPHAPWILSGESIVGLAMWRGRERPVLAPDLSPLPGPCLIAATRYTGTPAGPYLELLVASPARLGIHPGWCVHTMVVDTTSARMGLQLNWGYPAQIGSMLWHVDGDNRELVWEERGIVVRGRATRIRLPWLVPVRMLQRRSDACVLVPGRLRGVGRPGRVSFHAYPGDDLAAVAGAHPGVLISSMRTILRPARLPIGMLASLRAPLRAPEPALTGPVSGVPVPCGPR